MPGAVSVPFVEVYSLRAGHAVKVLRRAEGCTEQRNAGGGGGSTSVSLPSCDGHLKSFRSCIFLIPYYEHSHSIDSQFPPLSISSTYNEDYR